MKLNMKARLKSWPFWAGIIGACFYIANTSFGLGISDDTVNTVINVAAMIATALGVAVDPTTAGVGDSSQALTYDKPKKEDNA